MKKLRVFLAFTILIMFGFISLRVVGLELFTKQPEAWAWIFNQAKLQQDNKSDYAIIENYLKNKGLEKSLIVIIESDKFEEEGLPDLPYDIVYSFFDDGKRYVIVEGDQIIDVVERE